MRLRVLTKTFVSVAATIGIAVGTLAGTGASLAAPGPTSELAAASVTVAPLAVNNLGLSTEQAKNVQRWLAQSWSYTDAIDGSLGPNSWKAFQRCLKQYWGYTAAIDGVVGPGTIKALQRLLKSSWGYTGEIDGVAGPLTQAAFKRFANAH